MRGSSAQGGVTSTQRGSPWGGPGGEDTKGSVRRRRMAGIPGRWGRVGRTGRSNRRGATGQDRAIGPRDRFAHRQARERRGDRLGDDHLDRGRVGVDLALSQGEDDAIRLVAGVVGMKEKVNRGHHHRRVQHQKQHQEQSPGEGSMHQARRVDASRWHGGKLWEGIQSQQRLSRPGTCGFAGTRSPRRTRVRDPFAFFRATIGGVVSRCRFPGVGLTLGP